MKQLFFTYIAFILCCNSIYADDKDFLSKSIPINGDTLLVYDFTNEIYVSLQKERNKVTQLNDLYFPCHEDIHHKRISFIHGKFWENVYNVHKWQLFNLLNKQEVQTIENLSTKNNNQTLLNARLEIDYKLGKIFVDYISYPNSMSTLFTSQRIYNLTQDIKEHFYLPPLPAFHEGLEHLFSNIILKRKDIEYFQNLMPV